MSVFRQRRGTAAALAAANETPASGQIIYETDTNRIKVGNGATPYNSLPYLDNDVQIADVVGLQAALNGKQASGDYAAREHEHLISQVTGLQSALDGKQATGSYALTTDSRLTDSREWSAATVTQAQAEAGSSTTRLAYTPQRVFQAVAAWWNASAAKTKLDGIATAATANATDAQLRDRATHTGTQAASTISNFTTAAASAAPVQSVAGRTGAVALAIADVASLQAALDGKAASSDPRLTDARTPADASVTTAKLAASLVVDGNVQTLRFRRGTSTDLVAANPTPSAGELVYESDTNKAKVGNGFSTYSALPFLTAGAVAGGGGGGSGAAPTVLLDALVFNGSSTVYSLQSGGQAVTPAAVGNVLISINGVIQQPNVSYSVSGSTITFLGGAPAASDTFFGVVLSGDGAHRHDAADLTSGVISTARLPLASTSSVGVVRVGSGLAIDGGGFISATPAVATLTDATITSVSDGNLLRYSAGRWRNEPETTLVDGGNF